MESGDDGWIRPGAAPGGEGLGGDPGLEGDLGVDEDDGWPECGWSAAGLAAPAAGPAAGPGAGLGAGLAAEKGWGHGGIPGFSAWVAAAVAVVAATAGVAVGLFLIGDPSPASAVAGAAPSAPASASASAPASARPAQLRVAVTGRVLAVSRTSITIGGAGPSVTAAVTAATTVTGRAHGIGGVKAGDQVSAQLTGTAAHLTATAIADPASA